MIKKISDEIELSIIVPLYNVEKYVSKCIKSLLKIKKLKYEIIIVNDGSTDKSLQICESFRKENEYIIKIINQRNMGLSAARNTGMSSATGKYICFIDSDDYIDAEKLCQAMLTLRRENISALYFGYYFEKEGEIETKFSFDAKKNIKYKSVDLLKEVLKKRTMSAAVCFGIYNRKLIVERQLFFKEGILHEDERWTPTFLLNIDEVYLSDLIVYHYVQRENSIMHKKDKTKNGIDLIDTANYLEQIFLKIEDKKLRKLFRNRQAMLYMKGTAIGRLYRNQYRKYINRFFPIKHSCIAIDFAKSIIFMFSPYIYCKIAYKIKGEKNDKENKII